jgi:hypothetical protein
VVELPALTTWELEQDLSHNALEINPPPRIVEERGRGIFIKKRSDLQQILDHQAQLKQSVKLSLSVRDSDRTCEFWFAVPVRPVQNLVNLFQNRIQDYSRTCATPLLANSSQGYRIITKEVNETVEIWYTPVEWFSDEVLLVAYKAVPKEWVAFHDIEVFIAPIYYLKP